MKRMRQALTLLILSVITLSSLSGKPKVALVLSGGGSRGVAHIAVLEMIEEAGIPVDMILGTSMGALIGGLYAAGYSPSDIRQLLSEQDILSLFVASPVPRAAPQVEPLRKTREHSISFAFDLHGIGSRTALLGDQKIVQLLNDALSKVAHINDFDALEIPFRSVGTDLLSGEKIVFSSGSLIDAIRASISIPFLFTPYPVGESLIIDGALVDNLPIEEARNEGADIIIAVDVNVADYDMQREQIDSIGAMVTQLMAVIQKLSVVNQFDEADLLLSINLREHGVFDFLATEAILALAKEELEQQQEGVEQLVATIATQRPLVVRDPTRTGSYFERPDITIRKIYQKSLSGSHQLAYPFNLTPFLKLEGKSFDIAVKSELRRLFEKERNLSGYATITYHLHDICCDKEGLFSGDLEIRTNAIEPRDAAIGLGLFGTASATWSLSDSILHGIIHPYITATFTWNKIAQVLDLETKLLYDGSFSAQVNLIVPSQRNWGFAFSNTYGYGALQALASPQVVLDERSDDNLLSLSVAFFRRQDRRGKIQISLDGEFLWLGEAKRVGLETIDARFTLLPILTVGGVWSTHPYGLFPFDGTQIEASLSTTLRPEEPFYRVEGVIRQAFEMNQYLSWLYDVRFAFGRSRSALRSHFFDWGGTKGFGGYPFNTLTDELWLIRSALTWRVRGTESPFYLKLLTGVGQAAPSITERLADNLALDYHLAPMSNLEPLEAGFYMGGGFSTPYGDLLIAFGGTTKGRFSLFIELL